MRCIFGMGKNVKNHKNNVYGIKIFVLKILLELLITVTKIHYLNAFKNMYCSIE